MNYLSRLLCKETIECHLTFFAQRCRDYYRIQNKVKEMRSILHLIVLFGVCKYVFYCDRYYELITNPKLAKVKWIFRNTLN